jgi:hypothetical protein
LRALAGPWSLLRSSEAREAWAGPGHGMGRMWGRSDPRGQTKNLPYQTAQLSPLKQRQTKPHRELPLSSRPKRLRSSAHVIGTEVCWLRFCMMLSSTLLRGRAGLRRSVNAHKICQVCRLVMDLAVLCPSLQRPHSGGWNAPELLLTSTCLVVLTTLYTVHGNIQLEPGELGIHVPLSARAIPLPGRPWVANGNHTNSC